MDITGASALVTGAASGIGAAVARQLAAKGATVVVADLQADKGEALAEEIGGVFAQVDVTQTGQITAAVNAAGEIAPLRAVVRISSRSARRVRRRSRARRDSLKRTVRVFALVNRRVVAILRRRFGGRALTWDQGLLTADVPLSAAVRAPVAAA